MTKKIYQAYYTESDEILELMTSSLEIKKNDLVLEPCFGGGAFIDKLLEYNESIILEGYELNIEAFNSGKYKYQNIKNIHLFNTNILEDSRIYSLESNGYFDKIIGNPPYGGWLDLSVRKNFKKIYPFLHTKETYILFLYKMMNLLKENGKLSFIIPDTFLNLHMHTGFREKLWKNFKVDNLILFPSKFFPKVNYGYSNMCIINITKVSNEIENFKNEVKIFSHLKSPHDFLKIKENNFKHSYSFSQQELYTNIDHALFLDSDIKFINFINHYPFRFGDIADCVTGIYTGNDKAYLRVNSYDIKNSKNYNLININEVESNPLKSNNILNGLKTSLNKIEFLKGGGQARYLKHTDWFIDWSETAVNEYKTNKKSRFQNSEFYFKEGIGIPMIKSKNTNAFLIESRLFDQSIIGIFPKNTNYCPYILALLNSPLISKIVNILNPTANNSANYIKKIPFIEPSIIELQTITNNINKILELLKTSDNDSLILKLENINNEIITNIYKKRYKD